jgi:hypothetical protein
MPERRHEQDPTDCGLVAYGSNLTLSHQPCQSSLRRDRCRRLHHRSHGLLLRCLSISVPRRRSIRARRRGIIRIGAGTGAPARTNKRPPGRAVGGQRSCRQFVSTCYVSAGRRRRERNQPHHPARAHRLRLLRDLAKDRVSGQTRSRCPAGRSSSRLPTRFGVALIWPATRRTL